MMATKSPGAVAALGALKLDQRGGRSVHKLRSSRADFNRFCEPHYD